jgi:hypothetical protein
MDKIAFILGAGAHKPFDFPDGNTLKSQIAEQLQQPMVVVVAAYGCVFVITAGWIVSLALNTVGAFRGRVVSFVGLVLDFASMSAVLVRDFLNG